MREPVDRYSLFHYLGIFQGFNRHPNGGFSMGFLMVLKPLGARLVLRHHVSGAPGGVGFEVTRGTWFFLQDGRSTTQNGVFLVG